ncbi:MAG TPA: glycerophosphodiester phosphodiesterase family protein [Methanothrix sp.]|nr:glycerophosphodiester phosphodiesterase family protein [Methanothrix sp.]HPT18837.1 glycerophosphodiester phosphodiesterase family protein [Methanothrix sp.]
MAQVIAHRTAAALAPENSLEGIRAAAQCRADYVEMDVRLSRDGVLVLMHDESIDRTTGGRGRVAELSAEELRDNAVPSLKEAVDLAADLGVAVVVEMKEEGLEGLVAEALRGRDCIVTSFYHSSLRELSEISDLKTGIIISSLPVRPVELALWANASSIFPKRANPRLFKEAHSQGISVYPWTVKSAEEAAWLLRLGADGLVTDDPCLMRSEADRPVQATGRDNCPYYPCHHFQDQVCTHCFCPLYPCKDEQLGRFVRTKRGKRFWSCIDCRLVHYPAVAKYLSEHLLATTSELKGLLDDKDGSAGA